MRFGKFSRSTRFLICGAIMRYRRASSCVISLAAVVVLSAAACNSGSTAPANELTAARTRWARVAPAAYTYTISRSCECLPEMSGPVIVMVRNGVVESRQYTRSNTAVPAQYAELFPAVEGLFAIVDDAIRNGTTPLSVQYDLTLGFPTRIALGDPAADAPVYSVSDLRPR
jgi:Family of unknown function (DUF6174)